MASVKHGKRKFKGMSLEVAVRNPERYIDILRTFNKFDGRKLDDECVLEMYVELYMDRALDALDLTDDDFNRKYLKKYIVERKSHNNEWGFPTGYQSAFCRYLKTLSEFGFIYSQYNETFQISEVGRALLNGTINLSEAFALQSIKFWRKSPYRRVLNDFNFFTFIIDVLIELDKKGKRLSYNQFMVALFSDDGNVSEFLKLIEDNKVGASLEEAYNLVVAKYHLVDDDHDKVSKIQTAFKDYGNTVFRVLQLTGFITVDFSSVIMLSINKNRLDFYNELKNIIPSMTDDAMESEELYFERLGTFDNDQRDIILKHREVEDLSTKDYNIKLSNIVKNYGLDKDVLSNYLRELADNKRDSRCFWFIQAPLKLELLLTLFAYVCYGDQFEYKPNYKCDDAGIPYSHAPGNIGDIEVFNSTNYWLIEATLIRSKTQQINSETVNLFRHISTLNYQKKYLSLVAPIVHEDTLLIINVATIINLIENKGLKLYSNVQSIDSFVDAGLTQTNFSSNEENITSFITSLREEINRIHI